MKPLFFKIFLLQIPIVTYLGSVLLEKQKFVQNIEVIKNISSFSAITTSILIGLFGLLVVSSPQKGVEQGRNKRLQQSCISLMLLSLMCFIISTISLEIVKFRPFSISICLSLLISTLLILLGISKN